MNEVHCTRSIKNLSVIHAQLLLFWAFFPLSLTISSEPFIFCMLEYSFGWNSWQHCALEFINYDSHTSVAFLQLLVFSSNQTEWRHQSQKGQTAGPRWSAPCRSTSSHRWDKVHGIKWRKDCLTKTLKLMFPLIVVYYIEGPNKHYSLWHPLLRNRPCVGRIKSLTCWWQ